MIKNRNVIQLLSNLQFNTIDELISELFDKLLISVAIFDGDGTLQGICMRAKRCKCYYMLVHNTENQCSIFNPDFTQEILDEKNNIDKLCDYSCRLTARNMIICNKPHKVVIFQYNLPTDDLKFNPHNDPKFTPLYRGEQDNVDYFWKPNILSSNDIEYIFNYIRDAAEEIKSMY